MFFNIGPMELIVLGVVGLVVLGPERLPNLARDAARLMRSLRDMATGARTTLRDELGPEFADLDLRNLNPRTALRNALLGDDDEPPYPNGRTNGTANGTAHGTANGTGTGHGSSPLTARPQTPPMGSTGPAPFDDDAT